MTSPAAARKNKFGSRTYPIPRPGENQVRDLPAVSQVLRTLAAPGLETWRLKTVAEQFSKRPDLVMLAADPGTRYDAVRQALDATRGASNTGTAVHRFTEMVDDGTLQWDMIPDVARPWVERYIEAKDQFGWKLIAKEFTVYNHTYGYAGTSDRAMELPGIGNAICDIKSGKDVYADVALQLACYVFGEGVWEPPTSVPGAEALAQELEADLGAKKISQSAAKLREKEINEIYWQEYASLGKFLPMPPNLRQDVAYVIHLSDKMCELVPLDLSGLREVIEGICAAFHWKARKDVVGKPLAVPTTVAEAKAILQDVSNTLAPATEMQESPTPDPALRSETIRSRIMALSPDAKSEVAFNWPAGVPTLKQSKDHTPEQLQAIEDLLWEVECKYSPILVDQAVEKLQAAFPGSSLEAA